MRWQTTAIISVDLAAIAGLTAIGVGLDRLGDSLGLGYSLGLIWYGAVVVGWALLVARQLARQKLKR